MPESLSKTVPPWLKNNLTYELKQTQV